MKRFYSWTTVCLLALLAACGTDSPEVTVPSLPSAAVAPVGDPVPQFVHRRSGGPALRRHAVAFTASAGKEGEATLYFADGSPMATFRVSAESLRGATLNGTPIPAGEAVTITLAPARGGRFVVELEPSGLRFNPTAPGDLVFFYRHGVLPPHAANLSLWKRERADQPWERLRGLDAPASRSFSAQIDGFTFYALAH